MIKLTKTQIEMLDRYTPDAFHDQYEAMPEDEAILHKIDSVRIREHEAKKKVKKISKKDMKRLQKVLEDRKNSTTNGKS